MFSKRPWARLDAAVFKPDVTDAATPIQEEPRLGSRVAVADSLDTCEGVAYEAVRKASASASSNSLLHWFSRLRRSSCASSSSHVSSAACSARPRNSEGLRTMPSGSSRSRPTLPRLGFCTGGRPDAIALQGSERSQPTLPRLAGFSPESPLPPLGVEP
eukprot:489843-Prymnesium_polylepis.2